MLFGGVNTPRLQHLRVTHAALNDGLGAALVQRLAGADRAYQRPVQHMIGHRSQEIPIGSWEHLGTKSLGLQSLIFFAHVHTLIYI